MGKYQAVDDVYSALFVDFDNIYMRLYEQDQTLARTFASSPQRWTRWIEGHALRMLYGDGVRRRILKKVCYINPHRYREFRTFFVRSAFQVVDCPPHSGFGRTTAEIHLTMDVMDALAHTTHYDEIIIISGDADYTPLVMRVQEHARRSLVLAVGYTSPAYLAACSWRIREDWFTAQALEDPKAEDFDGDARFGEDARPARPPERFEPKIDRREADRREADRQTGGGRSFSLSLPANRRVRLVEAVKQLVAESSVPVPLPSVAQVLQQEQEAGADWFGAGTLRDLIEGLDISPLAFSSHGQGFVYDPDRHELPEDSALKEEFRKADPELFVFALKVHEHIDMPLLRPGDYTLLINTLVDEVNSKGFSRTDTITAVEDRCYDEGLSIGDEQTAFVVESAVRGGLVMPKGGEGKITAEAVRKALAGRMAEACRTGGMSLTDVERALLGRWLATEPPAGR